MHPIIENVEHCEHFAIVDSHEVILESGIPSLALALEKAQALANEHGDEFSVYPDEAVIWGEMDQVIPNVVHPA